MRSCAAHDLHFAQPFNTLSCPGFIDNPLCGALADYSPLAKRSRHERSPERSREPTFLRAREQCREMETSPKLEAARGIPMRLARRGALAHWENRSVNCAIGGRAFFRSKPINAD